MCEKCREPRQAEEPNLMAIWAAADKKARDWRETGEEKLLRQAFDAREGLKACGWRDGRYAPKDGSRFLVCGWDSTGVFPCRFQMGHFMVEDGGDLWPTSKVGMWKPMPSNAALTGAEGVRVEGTVMRKEEEC